MYSRFYFAPTHLSTVLATFNNQRCTQSNDLLLKYLERNNVYQFVLCRYVPGFHSNRIH